MKETISPVTLEKTVKLLCRKISDQIFSPIAQSMSEEDLRCELICCLLSSQVPFETARIAAINIRSHGLLTDLYWHACLPDLQVRLQELLSTPMNVGGRMCKYRFPSVRAKQICKTRNELYRRRMNLTDIVFIERNMKQLRKKLIFIVCGFGPKQASMFLRNIGCTYDLAILDRHVLRYMVIQGLISPLRADSISLPQYESIELAMENYAILLGYPIGYVDVAIWIAMRAAGGRLQ